MHGYYDGYDIRVPGIKADEKVVFVDIISPMARLLLLVLRQGDTENGIGRPACKRGWCTHMSPSL